MKRAILALAALAVLMCETGCHRNLARNGGGCEGCQQCRTCGRVFSGGLHGSDGRFCGIHGQAHHGAYGNVDDGGQPGPTTAQVGYPYYTLRGPRDFLLDNPPSIGR